MRLHLSRVCRSVSLICCGACLMQLYHWIALSVILPIEQYPDALPRNQDTVSRSAPIQSSPKPAVNVTSPTSKPGVQAGPVDGNCSAIQRPNASVTSDTWHAVHEKELFAYSAFLDFRTHKTTLKVLGVGLKSRYRIQSLYCHVWYPQRKHPVVVKASFLPISEAAGYRYNAIWFLCNLPGDAIDPELVSLSINKCASPLTPPIAIHTLRPSAIQQEHKFVVCICGPVKFNYSDAHQFVEWIETNSLYGAEKFVVYNHSGNSSILPYVRYYESEGRVDFLPWPLPLGSKDIKNFGHMALLNDCLYRNMYRSRHIAFLDLDELLVPKVKDTWAQVLEAQRCTEQASANFRNVFFKLEWADDEQNGQNATIVNLKLKSLLKTKRESKIWPFKSRSKYIARPELLLEAGVHFPHKYLVQKSNCDVPVEQAWVQHYRWWDDPKPGWIEDKTIQRFADAIIMSSAKTHSKVQSLSHGLS